MSHPGNVYGIVVSDAERRTKGGNKCIKASVRKPGLLFPSTYIVHLVTILLPEAGHCRSRVRICSNPY
jgi:hypothetical protein